MASNAQKTSFSRSLHAFGDEKAEDHIMNLPKRIPATVKAVMGSLVQVSLEGNWAPFNLPVLLVSQDMSNWAREPTQVGDKGYINGIDYYMGGQTGQGGGSANLYPRANLTNATFQPTSNKNWAASPNPNAYVLQGPQGVILQTMDGLTSVTLNASGLVIKIGGVTVLTLTSTEMTGTVPLTTSGDVTSGGISLQTHPHSGVTAGGANTGPPV